MANPLIYGAKEMTRINNDSFSCSCIFASNLIKPISFNETTLFYTPQKIIFANYNQVNNYSWDEVIANAGLK